MLGRLTFIGTVAGGLAIGLAWPAQPKTERVSSQGSDVVIARSADHHYYADVRVNGRPIHFMIDTGSSETSLTEDDARSLGLSIDPRSYEAIGDGASGLVRGKYVNVASMELGPIKRTNARAVVVAGSTVSLLGQTFLEEIDQITIRNAEMRLQETASQRD